MEIQEIREVIVEENEGTRIDAFLADEFSDISRSIIKKLIKDGMVTVNGVAVKPRYLVKKGDTLNLTVPEEEEFQLVAEDIPLEIIYDDEDVAVINKSQGMVVHPGTGNKTGTLVNALLHHFDSLSTLSGEDRPGIVHRIDKDTAGLLMIAKTDCAYESLSEQLREHTTSRRYYALVEGAIKEERGTINAPIGRHPVDRLKMTVTDQNSKEAVTHFTVLERYEKYTLIEARLETGRTHQIRVHMEYIHHPVVGDPVYGFKNQKRFKLQGQLLFAKALGFVHPRTGEYMEFEVELPGYFEKVLRTLRNREL